MTEVGSAPQPDDEQNRPQPDAADSGSNASRQPDARIWELLAKKNPNQVDWNYAEELGLINDTNRPAMEKWLNETYPQEQGVLKFRRAVARHSAEIKEEGEQKSESINAVAFRRAFLEVYGQPLIKAAASDFTDDSKNEKGEIVKEGEKTAILKAFQNGIIKDRPETFEDLLKDPNMKVALAHLRWHANKVKETVNESGLKGRGRVTLQDVLKKFEGVQVSAKEKLAKEESFEKAKSEKEKAKKALDFLKKNGQEDVKESYNAFVELLKTPLESAPGQKINDVPLVTTIAAMKDEKTQLVEETKPNKDGEIVDTEGRKKALNRTRDLGKDILTLEFLRDEAQNLLAKSRELVDHTLTAISLREDKRAIDPLKQQKQQLASSRFSLNNPQYKVSDLLQVLNGTLGTAKSKQQQTSGSARAKTLQRQGRSTTVPNSYRMVGKGRKAVTFMRVPGEKTPASHDSSLSVSADTSVPAGTLFLDKNQLVKLLEDNLPTLDDTFEKSEADVSRLKEKSADVKNLTTAQGALHLMMALLPDSMTPIEKKKRATLDMMASVDIMNTDPEKAAQRAGAEGMDAIEDTTIQKYVIGMEIKGDKPFAGFKPEQIKKPDLFARLVKTLSYEKAFRLYAALRVLQDRQNVYFLHTDNILRPRLKQLMLSKHSSLARLKPRAHEAEVSALLDRMVEAQARSVTELEVAGWYSHFDGNITELQSNKEKVARNQLVVLKDRLRDPDDPLKRRKKEYKDPDGYEELVEKILKEIDEPQAKERLSALAAVSTFRDSEFYDKFVAGRIDAMKQKIKKKAADAALRTGERAKTIGIESVKFTAGASGRMALRGSLRAIDWTSRGFAWLLRRIPGVRWQPKFIREKLLKNIGGVRTSWDKSKKNYQTASAEAAKTYSGEAPKPRKHTERSGVDRDKLTKEAEELKGKAKLPEYKPTADPFEGFMLSDFNDEIEALLSRDEREKESRRAA